MNILLHTIALEPARWVPQRVSQSLLELLPAIAPAGFRELEIYEPHLARHSVTEIQSELAKSRLTPVVLSSYLELSSYTDEQMALLRQRVADFGFKKVRLFPKVDSGVSVEQFTQRVKDVADALPDICILLETHDGSLADDPLLITRIVTELDLPNVGLLYQPTVFEGEAAWRQLEIQRDWIRHVHLQNRTAEGRFTTLSSGVIPWPKILEALSFSVDVTLEFVPSGICDSIADFNLEATLRQAAVEKEYLRKLDSDFGLSGKVTAK
jgi:sugar phosphate isomerase/epimerase